MSIKEIWELDQTSMVDLIVNLQVEKRELEAQNKELRKFVRHEETCATRTHLFGTHNCNCELAKLLEI